MSIVPTSSRHMQERRFDTANDNFVPSSWWRAEGWRCAVHSPQSYNTFIPPDDESCGFERASFEQGFWEGSTKRIKGAAA